MPYVPVKTYQCALLGAQQDLAFQIRRGVARREEAHPVRPRDHGDLTSGFIINVPGIHQTIQVEALRVFRWTVLVPGLPLGPGLGKHNHAVLAAPVIAENGTCHQAQILVTLDVIEVMRALLLGKPGNNVCLRPVQKLAVMLESRIFAVVTPNQPVEMFHLRAPENVFQHDVAITIELLF